MGITNNMDITFRYKTSTEDLKQKMDLLALEYEFHGEGIVNISSNSPNTVLIEPAKKAKFEIGQQQHHEGLEGRVVLIDLPNTVTFKLYDTTYIVKYSWQ